MFEKRARTSDSEQATSQVAETILHTTIDITDGCTEDEARSTNSKSPLLIISNSPSLLNPMSTAHGQSPDAPIIIDSPSHKYAPEIVATVSPARPSFSLTVRAAPSPSRPLRHHPLSQSAPGIPPALPDNQSLHVRGPQSTFPSGALPFPRRIRRVTESLSAYRKDIEATRPPFRIPSFSFACPTDILHEIPKTHRSYPALFRILKPYLFDDPKPPTFPLAQESWSERWKPQRAEEVLGNEEQAIYLRDWLAALRLQGITVQEPVRGKLPHNRKSKKRKRPDIIRQVKKRQKTGMEDFIASDGSDDESNYYDQQLDSELILASKLGCSSPSSHATSLASSPLSSPPATEPEDYELPAPQFTHGRTHLSSKLHNTILLCGPSGCGKTAAVYACAEELGWDVFEVFPGIGERNGPSLNKLVGDVGKNHLVKAVHQAHRFFGPQIGSQRMTESCHHPQLDGEDKPPNSPLPTTTRAARSMTPDQEVKQSLILVEEVDILYQTDTGFWNALINIIKECRRPVVLTCNGMYESTLSPYKLP